mgnify:CR=1 FL=1
MTQVQTVTGPIEVEQMGATLVHEHIFVMNEEYRLNYAEWDEQAQIADAVEQLTQLEGLGIDTIMDPTVLGLGRYIPRVQRIAQQVKLNIIVATGVYTYNEVPFQFHHSGPGLLFDQPEPMVQLFLKDLNDGIADTGVRAAFLKCAIEEQGLTPGVERVMRAVAQAHVRTGAPITVHTNPHTQSGLVAQRVLAEEGADLGKVVIGHSGDTTDVDYLCEVADAGSYLGMDRFGLDIYNPTTSRVDTIVALAGRGYADRMVLAHDASCYIDYFPGVEAQAAKEQIAPNWNFTHISKDVLPLLRERGVTEEQIRQMLVEAPRRYFE